MTTEKTIKGWLVVDWRNGTHRTRKSKPSASDLGTNDLLAKLEINVTVPKVDVPTLAVDIDVPEPAVYAATLEALDDAQLPGWTDIANERLGEVEIPDPFTADGMFDMTVDTIAMHVLRETDTRPDADQVRQYVEEMAYECAQPTEEGVDAS